MTAAVGGRSHAGPGRTRKQLLAGVLMVSLLASLLSAITLAVTQSPAAAAGWPAVWTGYPHADGSMILDPAGDINTATLDLASGLAPPGGSALATGNLTTVYAAADATSLFFRMRLAGSPGTQSPVGWDLSKCGITSSFYTTAVFVGSVQKAAIGINSRTCSGGGSEVYIAPTSAITVGGNTYDPTHEYTVSAWNATTKTVAGAAVTSAGNAAAPNEVFLDYSVPIDTLTMLVPGITRSTALTFEYGSSAAANLTTINKDFMESTATGSTPCTNCAVIKPDVAKLELTAVQNAVVSGANPPVAGLPTVYDVKLTATNPGLNILQGINVSDALPAGVSLVQATTSQGTISTSGSTVSWSPPDLAIGQSASATVRLSLTPTSAQIGQMVVIDAGATGSGTDAATNAVSSVTANSLSVGNVVGRADLRATTTGPSVLANGMTAVYSIATDNIGPSDVPGTVTVTDIIPAGLASATASGTGWTCTGTTTITCTRTGLASGASAPAITLTGTVTASSGSVADTASVSSALTDPVSGNNSSTSTASVVAAAADLRITSSAPGTAQPGSPAAYTITVDNLGPSSATGGITVTDTIPAGTTFTSGTGTGWSCSGTTTITCTNASTVASGGSAPALTVAVTPGSSAVSPIVNSASVTGATADPYSSNNSTTASVALQTVDLGAGVTGPATVTAGTSATYLLTASNTGALDSSGGVTLTASVPSGASFVSAAGTGWSCGQAGGVVTCSLAAGVAGGATSSAVSLVVAVAPSTTGSVTVTPAVSGSDPDATTADNSATVTSTVAVSADVSVTATGPATATAGTQATYVVTVANAGPSQTSGTTTLSVPVPAGTTLVSATGTGWTCTGTTTVACSRTGAIGVAQAGVAVTIVLAVAPATRGALAVTGTVAGASSDPATSNNTATVDTTAVASVDTSAIITGPATVTAGTQATYTLSLSNAGPSSTSSTLTLAAPVPANTTFVSASGTGWSCVLGSGVVTCTSGAGLGVAATSTTVSLVLGVSSSVTGTLTVSTTAGSGDTDPSASGDTASTSSTVVLSSNLSVAVAAPTTVTPGTNVTTTVTVSNAGPSDSAGPVVVTYPVPAGTTVASAAGTNWSCTGTTTLTCTRAATLAVGETAPALTVVLAVTSAATGTLSGSLTVAGPNTDADTSDNTASLSSGVTASANLNITHTGPATVIAGATAAYTITVANAGPSDAVAGTTVTEALPAATTFVSATGTGWSCAATTSITCTRASGLASSTSAPAIAVVLLVSPSASASTITATATVSSTTTDPSTADNAATASTTVTRAADVSVAVAGTAAASRGANLTYVITASNAGPSTATSLQVTMPVPAGTTAVSATGTGWSVVLGAGGYTATRSGSLAPNADAPIVTVVVATTTATPATVTGTATVAAAEGDSTAGNNTASAVTTMRPTADLAVTVTVPAGATAGTDLSAAFSVVNDGPSDATGPVRLTVPVPGNTSLVSAAGSGWSCATQTGTVTCDATAGLATGTTSPAVTVVVSVGSSATGAIGYHATVTGPDDDLVVANNTASASVAVQTAADLALTTGGPATVKAGDDLSRTFVLSNNGPSFASGLLTVTLSLPAGATLASATGTGWSCSGTTVVTCTRGTGLAVGEAAPALTVVVHVAATASGPMTIGATTAGPDADAVPANNTVIATVQVEAAPAATTTTTAPAPTTTTTTAPAPTTTTTAPAPTTTTTAPAPVPTTTAPARRPLVVTEDFAGGPVDQSITVKVLANDTDPDGSIDPSTLTVTVGPEHGTITAVDKVAGTVTYVPAPAYSGSDQFTYRVCDKDGFCGSAAVHMATPPIDISLKFVPVGDVRNHDVVRYDVFVTNNGPRVSDGDLDLRVNLSPFLTGPEATGTDWQFAGTRVGGARLAAAALPAAGTGDGSGGPIVAGTYPRSLGVNETTVVRVTARLDAPAGAKIVNAADVKGAFAETNMDNNAAAFAVAIDGPAAAAAVATAPAAPSAPRTPAVPAAAPAPAPAAKGSVLARTGASLAVPVTAAVVLLGTGLLFLLMGRRRRRQDDQDGLASE